MESQKSNKQTPRKAVKMQKHNRQGRNIQIPIKKLNNEPLWKVLQWMKFHNMEKMLNEKDYMNLMKLNHSWLNTIGSDIVFKNNAFVGITSDNDIKYMKLAKIALRLKNIEPNLKKQLKKLILCPKNVIQKPQALTNIGNLTSVNKQKLISPWQSFGYQDYVHQDIILKDHYKCKEILKFLEGNAYFEFRVDVTNNSIQQDNANNLFRYIDQRSRSEKIIFQFINSEESQDTYPSYSFQKVFFQIEWVNKQDIHLNNKEVKIKLEITNEKQLQKLYTWNYEKNKNFRFFNNFRFEVWPHLQLKLRIIFCGYSYTQERQLFYKNMSLYLKDAQFKNIWKHFQKQEAFLTKTEKIKQKQKQQTFALEYWQELNESLSQRNQKKKTQQNTDNFKQKKMKKQRKKKIQKKSETTKLNFSKRQKKKKQTKQKKLTPFLVHQKKKQKNVKGNKFRKKQ